MTYKKMKDLSSIMLSGDMSFPDNEAEATVLLQYALEEIGLTAYSEKLIVKDIPELTTGREIMDIMPDGKVKLRPMLPTSDDDIVDIDEGLCYPVARFMASVISMEKMEYHRNIAFKEVEKYNKRFISISERVANGQ